MKKILLTLLMLVSIWATGQSVTLDGSGTDPEGGALTYKWRQLTGPVLVTYSPNDRVAKPSVSATWQTGVYSFELIVTDPQGATGKDTMSITVTRPNASPKANAGPDQTLTLPASVATIGQPDAPGLSVQWVKMSGPVGTIKLPNQSQTDVTGLVKGQYVFRKIVRDAQGLTGSDDVTVTVKKKCFWFFEKLGWC